jgi:Predicted restriction endonuclease
MEQLDPLLHLLSERHRQALLWFQDHAGEIVAWPLPSLDDGILLATKAKGIYKPEWSTYALSVKQTLREVYDDKVPVELEDGTWMYAYAQEGSDPTKRDEAYTNRGLMACMDDRVPVGVMVQVHGKPDVQYRILGLALVTGWDGGYFFLSGFSRQGAVDESGLHAELATLTTQEDDRFDPSNEIDGRKKILATLVQRQGQHGFRQQLIDAYQYCAISDCDVLAALEAAHIQPYRGQHTNHVTNGLLLRADLHSLFDQGLLAIDTASMTVLLAPQLRDSAYKTLFGRPLHLPKNQGTRPNKQALDAHRKWAKL